MRATAYISILALALMLGACGNLQMGQKPLGELMVWEELSPNIQASVADYADAKEGVPPCGTLAVLPGSGELYLTANGEHGLFHSTDHGESWERIPEADVKGRTYGGFSTNVDPETGRMILFTVKVKNVPFPTGAMTVDGGKTWTPVNRAENDGYSWGMADWSVRNPKVVLAKQHHGPAWLWLSKDGGQTWKRLDFQSREPGVIDTNTFVAWKPETENEEGGIYRSIDQGKTWDKVSDIAITGKTPFRYGGNFYWTCRDGVAVSRDQGKTWQLCGAKVPGALWGPYFGRSEKEMMVVSQDGFFATDDGCRTWTKLHDFYMTGDEENNPSYNITHPTSSFGWDPEKGYLYCGRYWWTIARYRYK
ncbi:MAG: WD40/YVTN/BNR-like repeat-containing protein [Candidatus Sumerlaeia bacterium]